MGLVRMGIRRSGVVVGLLGLVLGFGCDFRKDDVGDGSEMVVPVHRYSNEELASIRDFGNDVHFAMCARVAGENWALGKTVKGMLDKYFNMSPGIRGVTGEDMGEALLYLNNAEVYLPLRYREMVREFGLGD